MTKTIEELAKQYAKDFIMEHKSRINNDAPLTHECVQYAIERIFAMPLSERLTAEEKERAREMYDLYMEVFSGTIDVMAKEYSMGRLNALKSIFGEDFFKGE